MIDLIRRFLRDMADAVLPPLSTLIFAVWLGYWLGQIWPVGFKVIESYPLTCVAYLGRMQCAVVEPTEETMPAPQAQPNRARPAGKSFGASTGAI